MTPWRIEQVTSPDQIDAILAIEVLSFTNPWTREMYQAGSTTGVSSVTRRRTTRERSWGFARSGGLSTRLHINNLAV
jgi:hypothetical protein